VDIKEVQRQIFESKTNACEFPDDLGNLKSLQVISSKKRNLNQWMEDFGQTTFNEEKENQSGSEEAEEAQDKLMPLPPSKLLSLLDKNNQAAEEVSTQISGT